MDADTVTRMLVNPFYAINIAPDLAAAHEPMIDHATWIEANRVLIKQIGPEEWLARLLATLQGEYPRPE